jgi:hypothetical protein
MRDRRIGRGAPLGKEAVLADSGRADETPAWVGRVRRADFFNACWNSTGDPALRWEVARVWRLGRRVSYRFVSAQLKLRPARQARCWALIGGKQIGPRRLCSSRQRRVLLMKTGWCPVGLWCHYGTASGEPASTTDQKPALESAGLCGQVESGHPSLPSSLGKLAGEPVDSRASCPAPLIE